MEGTGGRRRWPQHVMLMLLVNSCQAQDELQSYSVVAPSTIRPNTDYFAAITMGGITGDLQVNLFPHIALYD